MRKYLLILLLSINLVALAQNRIATLEGSNVEYEPTSKIYSIIIGINRYENLPYLSYASSDAKSFYSLLVSPVFNIDPKNISLLVDSAASRSNIYEEMYNLENKLKPNDLLIFYFAGHGDIEAKIQTNNSLLLLPKSPKKNYLRSGEYLDMNTLKDYFISLSNKKVKTYFICDACHSGNLIGGIEGQRLTSTSLQQTWSTELKFLSCQPNELSQEGVKWGNGRGVFSFYLELAFQGMSDNGDGRNTLGEIKRYIEREVAEKTNDKQNPVIIGDPKTVVSKVNAEILAKIRNRQSAIINPNTPLVTRGRNTLTKLDSLVSVLDDEIKIESEFQFINENVLTLSTRLLSDTSVKEIWPNVEKKIYEYGIAKFAKIVQLYYDDQPLNMIMYELNDLEKYLTNSSGKLTNKIYRVDLQAKLSFLRILISITRPNVPSTPQMVQYINTLKELKLVFPSAPYIYKQLSELLLALNKYKEANSEINNYISLLPNDAFAFNFAGLTYFKLGNNENSIEAFQKAILLKPDFSDAYYNLGVVFSKLGRKNEAKAAFDKSSSLKQPREMEY